MVPAYANRAACNLQRAGLLVSLAHVLQEGEQCSEASALQKQRIEDEETYFDLLRFPFHRYSGLILQGKRKPVIG